MASRKAVVGLIALSLAVTTLAFNQTFAGSRRSAAKEMISAPVARARVVRVSGEDFKFDAPDVVPAGLTEFRFLNKGPAFHHMQVLKLSAGKTVDDLRAALANPGPSPAWVKLVGGPNAPSPGSESNATVMLEPGNYALICFIDLGGPPHFMKGMLKGLKVEPAKAAVAGAPKADITATLVDYGFKFSGPVRAGNQTIRVYNAGPQPHEIELVRLNPGVSAGDFMKWFDKMQGPPPGKALGGIAGLAVGMSAYFAADFTPGNYALICFLRDTKDGKPHFVHGMLQQITVN
jgi:hypothetical protein